MLGTEVGARILGLGQPATAVVPYWTTDPVLRFRTAPGPGWVEIGPADGFRFSADHNSRGFRDEEHTIEPGPGLRVMTLGDSFTYGAAAPQGASWPLVLEELLTKALEGPVEVINAGIPRSFPSHTQLLYEHEMAAFDPDLVLHAVSANDVVDTHQGLDYLEVWPSGDIVRATDLGPLARWLIRHSRAASVPLGRMALARPDPLHVTIDGWREVFAGGPRFDGPWTELEGALSHLSQEVTSAGARYVLIYVPTGPYDLDRLGVIDASSPRDRFARWARGQDVPFVDTTGALYADGRAAQRWWRHDPHCNERGYRTLAEAVRAGLSADVLLPRHPGG